MSAEVVLTDEEYNELNGILSELETINEQQATQISELETELSEADKELETSQKETAEAEISFDVAVTSSKELEKDRIKDLLVAIAVSIVGGFTAGYLTCMLVTY